MDIGTVHISPVLVLLWTCKTIHIQLEIIKYLKLKIQFIWLNFYIIDTMLHKSIYSYLKLFYFIIKKVENFVFLINHWIVFLLFWSSCSVQSVNTDPRLNNNTPRSIKRYFIIASLKFYFRLWDTNFSLTENPKLQYQV